MIKQSKGITLIALVITIILLLILAGITIAQLTGENGLFARAKQAKEKTETSNYKEQIELIKANLQIQNEDYKLPTIAQLKDEFDNNHKKWVSSTEKITDNEKEKLKLITKEGYIFYITENTTEYKGKGEVVDTSALQRDDVIKLEITQETEKGKLVQITDLSGQNYYKIKYQINGTEEEWQDIKSGNEVEVPYGGTIYAKLFYASDSGIIHRLSVENSEPKVVAKEIDLSNLTRKTEKTISDLFEITWGSDGTGRTEYTVTGNLNFNNTSFNSTQIENIRELELGTYTVTCKVVSPTNKTVTATKENVKVTTLANTSVTNASNTNLEAKAIYSEYDLAYFRDLVNGGQTSINAKIMNDIDLEKVCDWNPIGAVKNDFSISSGTVKYNSYFSGILDGNLKKIYNLTINSNSSSYSSGLFGAVKDGMVKNCILQNTNIVGDRILGSIAGYIDNSNINNCIVTGKIEGNYAVGGIIGFTNNTSEIYACKNETNIIAGNENNFGGITGVLNNGSILSYCYNEGSITGNQETTANVGGIVGRVNKGGTVNYVYNNGIINLKSKLTGGIVGTINSQEINVNIENCYNLVSVLGDKSILGCNGGIIGAGYGDSNGRIILKNLYNKGQISKGQYLGGIWGYIEYNTLEGEILNYGEITEYTTAGAIGGYVAEQINNATKRAYGGNCSSSMKTNGTGTNNSYDANLVMPTVYSVVYNENCPYFYLKNSDTNNPRLMNLE